MPDNLQTPVPDETWNNPRSLGFSTWLRHTTASFASRMPLIQRQPGGFEGMYERHASFAGGLLARQLNQARSGADPGKFAFGVNQGRGSRYRAARGEPVMQELPVMRYSASSGTTPARAWQSPIPGGLSPVPTGGKRSDAVTGSAGLFVQANSTLSRALAPEDWTGSSELAQVAAMSKAGNGAVAVERTGQRDVAPKEAFPGYSQTANASASDTQAGDALSESKAKGYQEREHTQRLPVSTDAAKTGAVTSRYLPDNISSRVLVQPSIPFSHRHPVDVEPRPRLPLTLGSGTPGVIAPRLQNNGSGGMASRALELCRLPSAQAASTGLMPMVAPSGAMPSGRMAAHGDGRVTRDERLPHRLSRFLPMIATHRDALSTQPALRLAPTHLTGTSRLSGPALQPLHDRLRWPPEIQPVRNGLPITRSIALQPLPRPGNPETLPPPLGATGIPMSPRQAHHRSVLISRETTTQSTASLATSRYAAATGGPYTVPHTDRQAARAEFDPASYIPLRPAAGIPDARPAVQRSSGNGTPWGRWDPWNLVAAGHRSMLSSIPRLSRFVPMHATEATRLSGPALRSLREPITSGIHAPLHRAGYHHPRQHNSAPMLHKTTAASAGDTGMNGFSGTPEVANAVVRLDRSTAPAHIERSSSPAELPPAPHGPQRYTADSTYEPAVTGDTPASSVLAATAAAAFSATPSAIPVGRRLAVGISGAQPVLRRRIQNNSHSIAFAPLTFPHASHRRATAWSTGHGGVGVSTASTILAGDARIADDRHGVTSYQQTRGAYSGWAHGVARRPLVVARRAYGQLLSASDDAASVSAYSPLPAQPEDRYGVVPAPREGLREVHGVSGSEGSGIAAPPRGEPDPDELAEHVWRIMVERLVIEQERRGLAKWP